MKSLTLIYILFFYFILTASKAQIVISNNQAPPDPSAMTEVISTDQGWLIPRMTTAQRDAIPDPAEGLMIYNTESGSLEYFKGLYWVNIKAAASKDLPCGDKMFNYKGLVYGTIEYKGRCWLDRNLGARKIPGTINDTAGAGFYYQWGRGNDGHQFITSTTTTTLASDPDPGHDMFILSTVSPYDWLTPANHFLWSDSSDMLNNPCPPGWKIPSLGEWSWAAFDWTDYFDAFNSPLKLPARGYRLNTTGAVSNSGNSYYWTNQANGIYSFSLTLTNSKQIDLFMKRAIGRSVRCVENDNFNTPVSIVLGGNFNDYGKCIAIAPDGGFVLQGYTNSFGAQSNDYLTMKLDDDYNLEWSVMNGFYYYDVGRAIVPASGGGYVINGEAGWGTTYNKQMYVIKIDANGDSIWDTSVGSTGDESGYDVVEDTDGGFVCVGSTNSSGAGLRDILLTKLDAAGNVDWGWAIGTSYDEQGFALIKDIGGGYAIIGEETEGGFGGKDMKFVVMDNTLAVAMAYLMGGTGTDVGTDLVLAHDSGYVMAGYTNSFGNGSYDYYIRKKDRQGNNEWEYTYGGTENDLAYGIILTQDNGFAIIGYTHSFGTGYTPEMWLVKIDSLGLFQWSFAFGFNGYEEGYSLIQKENGNILALGGAQWFNIDTPGNWDFLLVEFTLDGKACMGMPYSLTSDGSFSAEKFLSRTITELQVRVTKLTDNDMPVTEQCHKLINQSVKGTRAVTESVSPEEIFICK